MHILKSREYLEHLWWLMHHSYLPGRTVYALTSYLDDSGSDDLSPLTMIGGPIMSKDAFIDFGMAWTQILARYGIYCGLHMADFVRPYGKYIGIYPELKLALFREVALAINTHKLYSMSISVPGPEFDSLLSSDVRKALIGPYALAFFSAVLSIHEFSCLSRFFASEVTSFLVDTGFPHSDQLLAAHGAILDVMRVKRQDCFVGAMAFDTDTRVPALQAADVIAWASRRKSLGNLMNEFEPLNAVLDEQQHLSISIPVDAIGMFATPINNWLTKSGELPALRAMLR